MNLSRYFRAFPAGDVGIVGQALYNGAPESEKAETLTEISLEQANDLINAVLKTARAKEMPPLAVAVLDAGAHLKALQREDGVSFLRVQIAEAKAWGALGMACDTDALAERYLQGGAQQGFIDALNAMTGGRVIPLPGGVLVRNRQGEVIGAVGAAGGVSEEDDACVRAALETLGFG